MAEKFDRRRFLQGCKEIGIPLAILGGSIATISRFIDYEVPSDYGPIDIDPYAPVEAGNLFFVNANSELTQSELEQILEKTVTTLEGVNIGLKEVGVVEPREISSPNGLDIVVFYFDEEINQGYNLGFVHDSDPIRDGEYRRKIIDMGLKPFLDYYTQLAHSAYVFPTTIANDAADFGIEGHLDREEHIKLVTSLSMHEIGHMLGAAHVGNSIDKETEEEYREKYVMMGAPRGMEFDDYNLQQMKKLFMERVNEGNMTNLEVHDLRFRLVMRERGYVRDLPKVSSSGLPSS